MKLWLDETRPPPDESWVHVKTVYAAMKALECGEVATVSFGYDFGTESQRKKGEVLTGFDAVSWMEYMYRAEHMPIPEEMYCHSANPEGRARIEKVIALLREFQEGAL